MGPQGKRRLAVDGWAVVFLYGITVLKKCALCTMDKPEVDPSHTFGSLDVTVIFLLVWAARTVVHHGHGQWIEIANLLALQKQLA